MLEPEWETFSFNQKYEESKILKIADFSLLGRRTKSPYGWLWTLVLKSNFPRQSACPAPDQPPFPIRYSASTMLVNKALCVHTLEPPLNLILPEVLMNHFSSYSSELRFVYEKQGFIRTVNTNPHAVQPSYSTVHFSWVCQVMSWRCPPVTCGPCRTCPRPQRREWRLRAWEALPQVALRGRGRGSACSLLPPGQSAVPLAEGTAGTFILANIVIKHLVFGMSGVQEKCLSRRFHCMASREVSPGTSVSSLRRGL